VTDTPRYHDEAPPRALVLGCAGTALSTEEAAFFRDVDPLGFILFARNCETPDQLRALVDALRACVGRAEVPVLIDQEGGRVARLGPPHWRAVSAMAVFGALARRVPGDAVEAARLNARLIAHELFALGITMDCAPVLDVPVPGAHDIIGDRAFDDDPHVVGLLGRAVCEGLLEGGVLPVIKHIPGHGRATADSHAALPVVRTGRLILEESDFVPFRMLNDMPWAMTAHVLYPGLDADRPATVSPSILTDIVRDEIGFEGVVISDDISMAALAGAPGERAAAALAAGCDVVLHCNGDMAEMRDIAAAAGAMSVEAQARFAHGEAMRDIAPEEIDVAWATARLDALLRPA